MQMAMAGRRSTVGRRKQAGDRPPPRWTSRMNSPRSCTQCYFRTIRDAGAGAHVGAAGAGARRAERRLLEAEESRDARSIAPANVRHMTVIPIPYKPPLRADLAFTCSTSRGDYRAASKGRAARFSARRLQPPRTLETAGSDHYRQAYCGHRAPSPPYQMRATCADAISPVKATRVATKLGS
jgi:hypothetical protein